MLCKFSSFLRFCQSTMTSVIKRDLVEWSSVPCELTELRIDITLDCGQSFRWHKTDPGIWTGVMDGHIWMLSQTDHELLYYVHQSKSTVENSCEKISVPKPTKSVGYKKTRDDKYTKSEVASSVIPDATKYMADEVLRNYFQLDIDLDSLYKQFSDKDENFRKKAGLFKGVRLLQQDPVETLFSFICSSNNNIARISGMVERMCQHFGDKIAEFSGVDYYAFPSVERLAGDDVEKILRDLGFGYRAKFIAESAKQVLSKGGAKYLSDLRLSDYESAKAALIELQGVGAKVADCVCLMSLGKMDAIPVDTHVKQIAERDYSLRLTTKSCTDAVYNRIGEHFRSLWGSYAGWAQCVLFASDLKKFQEAVLSKTEQTTDDVMVNAKQNRKRKR